MTHAMATNPGITPLVSNIDIPNGFKSNDYIDSDEDNAAREMAALEGSMNGKLHIDTGSSSAAEAQDPTFNEDPLSATALISPLHSINWDKVSAQQPQSLNSVAASNPHAASRWESFKRTGPRYPPSLEKLLLDYHHKHSKSWQLVHDQGAGSGVYSPVLARYFRHVHVSDPNSTGLKISRHVLSAWAADNKKSRGRFTFSKAKIEEGHENVADRTVDMAIIMQGAHFSNPDVMIRSAAQTLAQNGTLAVVSYSPTCRVTGNPAANDAVQRLFAAWGTAPWDIVCGSEAKGKKQFSSGLDFVPLPDDLFDTTKTRRYTINGGKNPFAVPGTTADKSDSKVRNGEREHDYSSEAGDKEASGWQQDVGPEFFRSMTAAVFGSQGVQRFESHFQEIEKVIQKTSQDGIMITVEWTAAVVLATRR